MEDEPDHDNVEQNLCVKTTTEEELNKSFNLEASLSKFSYLDLDKELELRNDLVRVELWTSDEFLNEVLLLLSFMIQTLSAC